MNLRKPLLPVLLLITLNVNAQDDTVHIKEVLRTHINALAAPEMLGRGYVDGGLERAADYINKVFTDLRMKPVGDMGTFEQWYSFPVNTFPGRMKVVINDKELVAGSDFLVDAGSVSYTCRNKEVRKMDLAGITDVKGWKKVVASLDDSYVWYLANVDSFCKTVGLGAHGFSLLLPVGCFIIPQKTKQMWTVAQEQINATILYVKEDALPKDLKTASIDVTARMKEKTRCENIIASVPGMVKDSFIVFSAHYDHLGKMGADAIFPGASDNASGTAMMLYLASYFAAHPQKYTMVFIAFSGEEAGLLGSAYFVKNAPIPLKKIKFLVNTDIMGDATDGITVVNATEYPRQFTALMGINEQHKYLPMIKSRGKAANSDHYYFSEAGVPAIFIYSNGGKGYYHDIYDKPGEITLNNVSGVARLLEDFVGELK